MCIYAAWDWLKINHDFFSDIATPIILILTAVVFYVTFKNQREANRLQKEALEAEKKKRLHDEEVNEINRLIGRWQNYLNSLTYQLPIGFRQADSPLNFDQQHGLKAIYDYVLDLGKYREELLNDCEYFLDQFFTLIIQGGVVFEKISASGLNEKEKQELSGNFYMFFNQSIIKSLHSVIMAMEEISGRSKLHPNFQETFGTLKLLRAKILDLTAKLYSFSPNDLQASPSKHS